MFLVVKQLGFLPGSRRGPLVSIASIDRQALDVAGKIT
jgi:hypothetical protein